MCNKNKKWKHSYRIDSLYPLVTDAHPSQDDTEGFLKHTSIYSKCDIFFSSQDVKRNTSSKLLRCYFPKLVIFL